jgi:integrase
VLVVKNRKTRVHWELVLGETYCARILPKRVNEISVDDILGILKPVWTTKKATGICIRSRIERVLTYAKGRGWRTGENVAAWKDNLAGLLSTQGRVINHHASIPFDKAAEVVADLRKREGVAARALEFMILTGTRVNEAIGCQCDEIDFERGLWTIPASRMKLKKEHVIPLSERALEIVREMQTMQVDGFVFPGARAGCPISHTALTRVMKRYEATCHGWRATLTDWASETTNHSIETIEFALSHGIPNKVRAAYRRYRSLDKRAVLMSDWARYLNGEDAKVIELATRRVG